MRGIKPLKSPVEPVVHLGLPETPLAADPDASNAITGSFLLIDAHDGWTLAAGMIDDEEGELL